MAPYGEDDLPVPPLIFFSSSPLSLLSSLSMLPVVLPRLIHHHYRLQLVHVPLRRRHVGDHLQFPRRSEVKGIVGVFLLQSKRVMEGKCHFNVGCSIWKRFLKLRHVGSGGRRDLL